MLLIHPGSSSVRELVAVSVRSVPCKPQNDRYRCLACSVVENKPGNHS